jgi:hypothetical protein
VWHVAALERWSVESCGEGSEVTWIELAITWQRVNTTSHGRGDAIAGFIVRPESCQILVHKGREGVYLVARHAIFLYIRGHRHLSIL